MLSMFNKPTHISQLEIYVVVYYILVLHTCIT